MGFEPMSIKNTAEKLLSILEILRLAVITHGSACLQIF